MQGPQDIDLSTAHCFACGPDNPHGLHLNFDVTGETVRATYECLESMSGWGAIQHGGITAAILDEACGYLSYAKQITTMTAKLQISYRLPIFVGETLDVRGHLTRTKGRVIEAYSEITGEGGEVRAEARATMLALTQEQKLAYGFHPPELKD